MPTPVRLVSLALVMALPLASCGSSRGTVVTAEEQLRFGAEMAQRGLWSEAFFRFQQARQLAGGAAEAKVLNNLAVASEALGKFDQALAYYKQAVALAPGEADLKANYDRFVSFYESFRARGEEGKEGKSVPAAPASSSSSGSRRPPAPEPPPPPAPGSPPGMEPPDVPPLIPEPAPTPPSPLSSTAGGASHA